jgi:spermidine/putrescine transport system substrate-binding protein
MRRVVGAVAVGGLALGVPALVTGAASATTEPPVDTGGAAAPETELPDLSGQSLTISNWDAYTPEGLIPGFEEASGAAVEFTTHATNEEIVAKVIQSGGEGYDVVFVSAQFAQQLDAAGLLLDIDPELVPNLEHLAPEAFELASDPGLTFSVPYTWGTTGLCYRSDVVTEAPTSWMDLLAPSEEQDGRVTMMATDRWLLLPAQKALGFSANTTDEAELDQVTDLLVEAKDHLLAYDDTTFYSRLVSGEADLVEAWDGWCNYGIAENPDIEFVIPEEGSDLWVDTMVILNTTESPEAAHAFINWVLDPANHAQVAELVLYKVPNPDAMAMVDPALLEQYPNLAMTPAELLEQEQLVDVGDAQLTYTDIVAEVTSS